MSSQLRSKLGTLGHTSASQLKQLVLDACDEIDKLEQAHTTHDGEPIVHVRYSHLVKLEKDVAERTQLLHDIVTGDGAQLENLEMTEEEMQALKDGDIPVDIVGDPMYRAIVLLKKDQMEEK